MRVAEQNAKLSKLNKPRDFEEDNADDHDGAEQEENIAVPMTEDDLRREEEEIKELERKKQGLEERVNSMSRDISGVLR